MNNGEMINEEEAEGGRRGGDKIRKGGNTVD
jgi:hypothetical protein